MHRVEGLQIQRVLCPVHLTIFSGSLLTVGSTVARRYGADLFTVHVLDSDHPRPDAVRRVGGRPSAQEAAIRLRGLVRTNTDIDPRDVTSVLRRGDPVAEIAAYAERMNADVIVAGRRLPAAFPRFARAVDERGSSVGSDLARAARCVVLTVPTIGGDDPVAVPVPASGVFQHIVCGVDFSRASLRALSHATALAGEAAGLLTVVHVVSKHATEGWPRAHERLTRRLHKLVEPRARERCGVRTVVAVGDPVDELARVVRTERADLLVLGVRGSQGTDDRECTAAIASREVECPVLLVSDAAGNSAEASAWRTETRTRPFVTEPPTPAAEQLR